MTAARCGKSPGARRARMAAVATAWLLAAGGASAEDEFAAKVQTTRTALEQWVENERLISKEEKNRVLAREVLEERIRLVEQEIDSLRAKITETEASIAEADKKREELIQENERLKGASASLAGSLEGLEAETRRLITRLPDPIRERIKPLSQRIPEEGAETKLSTSERYQNIVGILNEINKFHRELTVTSEVRTLEDGTSAEVTTVYLGISHGYYSGANGTIAGVGTSTSEGWEWKAANEAAPQVAAVVAILKNEQMASFVHLPLTVE